MAPRTTSQPPNLPAQVYTLLKEQSDPHLKNPDPNTIQLRQVVIVATIPVDGHNDYDEIERALDDLREIGTADALESIILLSPTDTWKKIKL